MFFSPESKSRIVFSCTRKLCSTSTHKNDFAAADILLDFFVALKKAVPQRLFLLSTTNRTKNLCSILANFRLINMAIATQLHFAVK